MALLPALLAGGTLLSGLAQSRAAGRAADAQVDTSRDAIAEQRRQFDLAQGMMRPYANAGQNALVALSGGISRDPAAAGADLQRRLDAPVGTYADQTGDNIQDAFQMTTRARNQLEDRAADARRTLNNKLGDARTGMFNRADQVRGRQFETDPGYQFRRDMGERAIERGAAARGNAFSGATMQALGDFNSGLASQEYGAFDARRARDYGTELGRAYNTYGIDAGRAQTIYSADMTNAGLGYDARMGQINDNFARRDARSRNLVGLRTGNIGAGYDAQMGGLNSLLGLAQLGMGGTTATVNSGASMASNVGNLFGNIGTAQANNAINQSNALTGMVDNGFGILGAANNGMFANSPNSWAGLFGGAA